MQADFTNVIENNKSFVNEMTKSFDEVRDKCASFIVDMNGFNDHVDRNQNNINVINNNSGGFDLNFNDINQNVPNLSKDIGIENCDIENICGCANSLQMNTCEIMDELSKTQTEFKSEISDVESPTLSNICANSVPNSCEISHTHTASNLSPIASPTDEKSHNTTRNPRFVSVPTLRTEKSFNRVDREEYVVSNESPSSFHIASSIGIMPHKYISQTDIEDYLDNIVKKEIYEIVSDLQKRLDETEKSLVEIGIAIIVDHKGTSIGAYKCLVCGRAKKVINLETKFFDTNLKRIISRHKPDTSNCAKITLLSYDKKGQSVDSKRIRVNSGPSSPTKSAKTTFRNHLQTQIAL